MGTSFCLDIWVLKEFKFKVKETIECKCIITIQFSNEMKTGKISCQWRRTYFQYNFLCLFLNLYNNLWFVDATYTVSENNSSATKRTKENDENDGIEILYETKSSTNKHNMRGKFFTSKKRSKNNSDKLNKNREKDYLSKLRKSQEFWKTHNLK